MESGQYPQSLPPSSQPNGKRPQWLPTLNPSHATDGDDDILDLGQVLQALRRRILVIAGVTTVVTLAALLKALSSPAYRASFQILTRPVTVETQVVSSLPQALARSRGESANAPEAGFDNTKLKLLTSPKILDPIVKQLQIKYPDLTYGDLASGIVIKPLTNTEVLEVGYEDAKPELVNAVLAELSQRYLNYSLEERLTDVRQGIAFIESQLPQLRAQVEANQERLQQFRQNNNLFDPDAQGKELSDQINTFRKLRLDNQVVTAQARSLYADLQNQLQLKPTGDAAALALKQHSLYQRLLEQLQTVDSQLAAESSLFVPNSPNVSVLRDQRSNILPLIQREAQRVQEETAAQLRDLAARDTALENTEAQLSQRLKQLSVIARDYSNIQRELQISTDNLSQFLAKQQALGIDAGQRTPPWQLLAKASKPKVTGFQNTVLLGGLLGLALGTIIALIVDRVSNVFHTPEEIKGTTRLPMLGVIPYNQELEEMDRLSTLPDMGGLFQRAGQRFGLGTGLKAHKFGALPFLEAFRSLYTNIRLLNPDEPVRSLVISSPTPQDGKSTIALYLAEVAAAMGQRVLLVDAELRRSQLHQRLGLANVRGLGDLIVSDLNYTEVMQRSPLEENLYVLTSGQVPRDPISLLASPKMQQLMEQFAAAFDLVIYDSPPLMGLSDANVIATKTDGLVIVSRLRHTDRALQRQALEGLRISPTVILGMVANDSRKPLNTAYFSSYQYQQPPQIPPVAERSPVKR
jgi:polysaccharide biosynthesis transport protein